MLGYTIGCWANAMLKPVHEMWRFALHPAVTQQVLRFLFHHQDWKTIYNIHASNFSRDWWFSVSLGPNCGFPETFLMINVGRKYEFLYRKTILRCFSSMTFLSLIRIFWVITNFRLYLYTNTNVHVNRNLLMNISK